MLISILILLVIIIYLFIIAYSLSEEKNKFFIPIGIIGLLLLTILFILLASFEASYIYILEECLASGGCKEDDRVMRCLKIDNEELIDTYNNLVR